MARRMTRVQPRARGAEQMRRGDAEEDEEGGSTAGVRVEGHVVRTLRCRPPPQQQERQQCARRASPQEMQQHRVVGEELEKEGNKESSVQYADRGIHNKRKMVHVACVCFGEWVQKSHMTVELCGVALRPVSATRL